MVYPAPSQRTRPKLLKFRSSRLVILTTVCAATFTDGFVYAVIVPVLPFALRDRYHVPDSGVQAWTSMLLGIFGGVTLIGSPIIGWAVDNRGWRRPAWTLGLVSLMACIVMLAASTELWVLVLSRILQGLSGSVVYTVGLALVADTVNPGDVGYYMGFALSTMSLGILVGPFLGGIVFEKAGFYAVVGLMAATALVDIVLRLVMIEKSVAEQYMSALDDSDTEHTRLLPPPSSSETERSPRPISISSIRKSQVFALLSNPRALAAIYGVFVHIGVLSSFDAVLALFVEGVFGWSPLDIGVCFLAIAIPSTLVGPIAGKLSDRYGPRGPAVAGFILTAIPIFLFQLVTHNSVGQVWLLYILLACAGSTLALIISPLAADLFYVVEHMAQKSGSGSCTAYAQSYGIFDCAMAGGTLAGPVVSGWLKAQFGWSVLTWALGAFSISGAVLSFLYTGRSDDGGGDEAKPDEPSPRGGSTGAGN